MIIQVTENIRKTIRDMRKAKGLRGDDISNAVGKSPSFISRIESGRTATIEDSILFAIFKIILNKDDSDVHEFIEMFLETPKVEQLELNIPNVTLSDEQKQIMNRFYLCLVNDNNSCAFLNHVISAIELSDNIIDNNTEPLVCSLSLLMRKWKQRRKSEQQEYAEIRNQIENNDLFNTVD